MGGYWHFLNLCSPPHLNKYWHGSAGEQKYRKLFSNLSVHCLSMVHTHISSME
jgi:hypothetical protein